MTITRDARETMADYSLKIGSSAPTARVTRLIEATRSNMDIPKKDITGYGAVLNEETRGLPLIIRKAMAEKRKLEIIPVDIWDDQIFAGTFSFPREKLIASKDLPVFASEEERREGEKNGFGIYSMFGHISPNYPRLLTLGITGIREMIQKHLAEPGLPEKSAAFLKASLISLEGFEIFAKRNAGMVYKKAEAETNPRRKEELLRTAEALSRCPLNPALHFFDACQAAWLLHVTLQLTGSHCAVGRPDQYLYPYLEMDLATGVMSVDEAQEIIDCYMLKFNERTQDNHVFAEHMAEIERIQAENERQWRERKVTDIGHGQHYNVRDDIDAYNHWLQNIMIGGVKPEDGSDATNYITVMMLETFRRLRMTNPVLSIRIHKNTPEWLYHQVAHTLKTGGGLPAIYNDEVVLKAYTNFGIDIRDARDYANNGCWEILLPGRTDFYFIKLNALNCMEWALNRGVCRVDGKQEAPDMGDPADFHTFDVLYDKVLANIQYVAKSVAEHYARTFPLRSSIAPTPFLSTMLDGPIENGRDMTDMSTRFVIGGIIAGGLSHVIDSLIAIDKLVYRDKKYTITDIVKAIENNFEGNETLWHDFSSCPKYGSNDPYANGMAKRFISDYGAVVRNIDRETPSLFIMPGAGTFSWYIAMGEASGASADGRRYGEPVASNFSPSAGAMIKGVTGALQSFCHLDLDLLPIGSPLDLGLAERYVAGEAGTERLVGLIKSFIELKGNLLTISVADVSTLKEAQQNPEKYRDLRVRMGGWSAYFTMLSPEQQAHHIKKSESGFF
ncbi:glycyl radical enzyme [Spirochaetia bacterium]|nr:glycyl radical enzyme [Spirochaetia bacterium]